MFVFTLACSSQGAAPEAQGAGNGTDTEKHTERVTVPKTKTAKVSSFIIIVCGNECHHLPCNPCCSRLGNLRYS